MIKVKIISENEITKKEWSEFVYNHTKGNVFQTPEMYEVYKRTKNYEPVFVGVTDNSGDIVGLLLSVIQKEFSGPLSIFSSRCVTWGGPLIKKDLDRENKNAVLETILKEQNKIAKKKALYMEFRNLWDTSESKMFFVNYGYDYEDHLNVLIDLTKKEDELWKQMKKSRRWGVKRANKIGLLFEDRCNVEIFYKLVKDTYIRAKIPLADKRLFKSVVEIMGPKNMANIFCAKNPNEDILASWFQLTYKNLVYDWYAGSTIDGNKAHANEYLGWNILLWSKAKGYKTYDFGGAGRPKEDYGPGKFKMEFGGTVVNYGRYKQIYKRNTMRIAEMGLKLWMRVS